MLTKPLVAVDLDGTLIDKSVLRVIIESTISQNGLLSAILPLVYLCIFKTNPTTNSFIKDNLDIIRLDSIHSSPLHLNTNVIKYLLNIQHSNTLALATGSDQYTCEVMAAFFEKYFGLIFQHKIGSQEGEFSISEIKLAKLKQITNQFGLNRFAYVGNSDQDISLWKDPDVDVICVGDIAFFEHVRNVTGKLNCILIDGEFTGARESHAQIFPEEYTK